MDYINTLFLIGAVLLCFSVLASSLSSRLGIPLLLIFLVIGMLAGVDGIGRIQFEDANSAFLIGSLALAIILLDGGMRTRVENFRVGLWPAMSLASVGVLISAALTGALTAWLLELHWLQGLLLGAIVGSTDAAAVFSLLQGKGLNLKQRVGATLEIESGSNDPMAIFLTITLVEMLANGQTSFSWSFALLLIEQFGIGALCGLAGGFGLVWLVNRVTLPAGLYPLLITSGAILVFAATNKIGGSGFLAIYLTGLILGNNRVRNLQNILQVQDGMAWLSQIGMFLMLGLLVTPSEMIIIAVPAVMIALFLILVARPIAVLICLAPFVFSWRERLFIAWVGLRGAVPIILAIFPLLAGLEQAQLLFNLAFVVVLVSLLLQGSSLPLAARLCKVEIPPQPEPLQRTSLDTAIEGDFELLVYQLDNANWCVGVALRDLKMPDDTRIAALFRGNHLLHPTGSTQLALGDVLCVVGRPRDLPALSKLFSKAQPPRRLESRSFFGDFILEGDATLGEVGKFYGFAVPEEMRDQTLAAFFSRQFGGHPVVGDQIEWEGHTWVVAAMDNDWILKVGLKLGNGGGPVLGF
ncbi:K+/H+ antiporter [Halopseudomonas pachastrellae]|uniref:K+/H+ antiporter n=1 Tax=Halopseudomonas pachastrellae TaxID=254161 RepID=A0A1S8DFU4_9GAMM|nr:potassium/proton antiporter [Halopseudomonas pachastrellae]MED5492579.1 potassium/proton antiporter [Pseudomonadota bacterium]ONM44253.1 K+/H+ antiporter [Halopseudomonas pachastrellae]WVM88193.1 potassium/proton antiporter [Halopseudomonas pachastrellae]SFM67615.1 cell volume regulation protein A [Halopseudomonas pachastrellae]